MVITEQHVKFLNSRGYKVANVDEAKAFVDKLAPRDQQGFMADAAAWKEPATEIPGAKAEEAPADGSQKYKVLRHLMHNEKLHKAGAIVSEVIFTAEQIAALLETKTIELYDELEAKAEPAK